MSRAEPATRPIDPPPADPAASSRDRTERQLAMLTRLAEIGMEIAEAAGRRAAALAEGGEAGAVDPGLSYARAARAVRLTIALQSRLAGDLAASSRAEAARRRDRIHRRVEQAIEAGPGDEDEVEQLSSAAWERLTDADDGDLLDRPMQEVVARICADLGLSPAWAASAFGAASPRTLDGAQGGLSHMSCDLPPPPSFAGRPPPLRRGGDGRRVLLPCPEEDGGAVRRSLTEGASSA